MPKEQMFLPAYTPSEADMVEKAISASLEDKINQAIGTLQMYEPAALRLSDRGYWLAYSGGKDSGVILELAKMAGVAFHAEYNVTGIDPPELVRFIKREHPEVGWNRAPVSIFARLVQRSYGPPTRIARWCCQEYKEQGGNGLVKLIGVRVAESARRAKLWRTYVPNKRHDSGGMVCPICYWTDNDVWEFHRLRNLPYCELYEHGFTRLGCVGCPLGGPANQAREFARWPRFEFLWKRSIVRFWETWHDVPRNDGRPRYSAGFASGEEMWDWWRSGERKDESTGCQGEFLFADYDEAAEE